MVLNNLLDGLNGKAVGSLTAEEKEARSNLVASIVAGTTTAAGGDAAIASAEAKIETGNNAVFIPFIIGAAWLLDKGMTTYDTWQDVKAIRDGKKTLEQLAQETGTNLQRMATGRAPIGADGKSVNLHRMTQTRSGPIAEMTQTFHQSNSKIIHINLNTIPSGIDRVAFDKWKIQYWPQRAANFGD